MEVSMLKGLWLRDRKTAELYRITRTGDGRVHYKGSSGEGHIQADLLSRDFELHTEKPLS